MSKKIYSDKDQKILSENINIAKVSDKAVTYTREFKVKTVKEYLENHKSLKQIFIEAGINIDILGRDKPNECLKRWKNSSKKYGIESLMSETRGVNATGRPSTRELSVEEKLQRAEAKIAFLQAENEFLKKLKALKRMVNPAD